MTTLSTATQIRRRYTPSNPEYKIYSETFDRLLINSTILNSSEKGAIIVDRLEISDLSSIKSVLFELTGDQNGIVMSTKAGGDINAIIPNAERKLALIHGRFDSYCNMKEAQGYKRPKVWPPKLLEERLKTEARLDVWKREAELLQNLVDHWKETKTERDASKVLQYGPRGNGQLKGGYLDEIDYQKVEYVGDILVIVDEHSPYKGMAVSSYREHIVEPVRAAQRKRMFDLEKQRKRELAETGFSKITIPSFGTKKVSKGSLPPWPKGVKNYLIEEEKEAVK
ncbi:MAG: hypothetical protein JXR56_00755 [Candidatus Cloacimonetes bacterium]|nr:hypothetical protein [Candidatus Cloacimonadota bacterium]